MNQNSHGNAPQAGPGAPRSLFQRVNEGLANVEASIAMGMLLLMLVVAFAQAALRNLTQAGFAWANAALGFIDWGDFVLQKGTLWLAFLGASLAIHSDKHVAIDILPRMVSPRGRLILRGLVGVLASVICFFLARAFMQAILVNGAETEAHVMLLTSDGSVHVCDASAAQLAENDASKGPFCLVRGFLSIFGVPMQTPGAAFQLIVPVMLFVMSVRTLVNGVHDFVRLSRGEVDHGPHGAVALGTDLGHNEGPGGHQ